MKIQILFQRYKKQKTQSKKDRVFMLLTNQKTINYENFTKPLIKGNHSFWFCGANVWRFLNYS